MDYQLVGAIGLANNSIVSLVTIWRTIRWYNKWENPQTWNNYTFRKKMLFHLLLLCTAVCDIPMYAGFIVNGGYTVTTYSFHKLASTFLFSALSITIGDWASVLKDINEYPIQQLIFRRATLISLNVIYIAITLTNFILLYTLPNLDSYLNSPMYTCGIFLQIIMNFLLTTMMLHAGLKLYSRIHGAVGNIDHTAFGENQKPQRSIAGLFRGSDSQKVGNNSTTTSTTNPLTNPLTNPAAFTSSASASFSQSMNFTTSNSVSYSQSNYPPISASPSRSKSSASRASVAAVVNGNMELKNALNNLNLVMATCTFCILLQMLMLTLNYALGYADKENKTVGPPFFYWTCSYYIPLWGPILALLYLSRSQSHRKRAKFLSAHHYADDGVEGSRTDFTPSKSQPRVPSQQRHFSSDYYDMEAYYGDEMPSPMIDGSTLLDYSTGGHSHNMLYANNLLAAQQQHHPSSTQKTDRPGKKGTRRVRRKKAPAAGRTISTTESVDSNHQHRQQNDGSAEAAKAPPHSMRKKPIRNASSDIQRSEVDVLTHQHRDHNSYSLNPTHASMSVGDTSRGSGSGVALVTTSQQHVHHLQHIQEENGEDTIEYIDGDDNGEYSDEYEYYDEEDGDGDYSEYDGGNSSKIGDNESDSNSFNMRYRDTNMTGVSLPSELIFPHNFNLRPPPAMTTAVRQKSTGNTASIAARLVSRQHANSTISNSGATATTGEGSVLPRQSGGASGVIGQMNSYDYSYRGEEERFDGVFR